LFIFGGVSNLSGEPKSPGTEFVVAIVGPLTSFVLAGLAFVVATFVDEPRLDVIASYLVYVNAVLGLFNLVPGFPLDGGRVLRSILWATTHNVERATRWASNVGRLVATLLLGYGAYLLLQREIVGGLWTAAIAYFLFSASSASVRQLVLETRLGGVLARDVAQPVGATVAPGITVAQVVEAFMLPRNLRAVPVTDNGRLVGVVTTSDVRRVPFAHRNEVSVAEIMGGGAGLLTVRAETPVIDAMELLNEHDLEQVPVLEGSTLIGLLTRADVLRQLQLREALSA
jgi:CBS domain-containing protein